jgi:hypothetical protein
MRIAKPEKKVVVAPTANLRITGTVVLSGKE